MRKRSHRLSPETVPLPRGTRVVLRVDIAAADGTQHRRASLATVREVQGHSYHLRTPAGREFVAQRDQIKVQREDVLQGVLRQRWDFDRMREHIIFSSVVGSRAWGLDHEDSDEDVRGAFLLSFEDHSGLWETPQEIRNLDGEAAYWEVAKLVEQGLRADANTLEALWSPIIRDLTPVGQRLIAERRMFVSMNILGSFGRYAESQFLKIDRSLLRAKGLQSLLDAAESGRVHNQASAIELLSSDLGVSDARSELKAILRSLADRALLENAVFDTFMAALTEGRSEELRPAAARPKNAYNLLRLLHSCLKWLREAEPLIEVQGELRKTLLGIKEGHTPLETTLSLARQVALEIEEASKSSKLPEAPDFDAADAWLRFARRTAARRSFAMPRASSQELIPQALPEDVDADSVRRFAAQYIDERVLWVALTGAHAYGFPSPDSDLDLKGVRIATAEELLGTRPLEPGRGLILDFEGREFDYTANDLGTVATLILKGNGNMLERLLGPYQMLVSEQGRQLQDLCRKNISVRCQHHYRGFFQGMRREYAVEKKRGVQKAKRLLYAYRVALTGCHLLRTGELQTDVRPLADLYGYPRVQYLLQIKQRAETSNIDGDDEAYLEDHIRLETQLNAAAEASKLPQNAPAAEELEKFVVQTRRSWL